MIFKKYKFGGGLVSRLKFRGEVAKRGGLRIFKIQGGGFQKGGVEKFRGVWTPDEAMTQP